MGIRALQGHTPDSGLTSSDFSRPVDYADHVNVAHGTLTERIPSILQKGLIAAGGSSREGWLFVHWSAYVLEAPGRDKYAGVRNGSDCVIIANLGDLRAAGISMIEKSHRCVSLFQSHWRAVCFLIQVDPSWWKPPGGHYPRSSNHKNHSLWQTWPRKLAQLLMMLPLKPPLIVEFP